MYGILHKYVTAYSELPQNQTIMATCIVLKKLGIKTVTISAKPFAEL